ncbi:MAG: ImmA/IrrE family metallo-endopeptidase [Bacteroidales bacterium]
MPAAVTIEPKMLTWAITRAGRDVESFIAEEPRVQHWLDGSKQPTLRQLEEFSKKVHVPFGYLFLDSPPKESLLIPFFRSETGRVKNVHINVYDTILLMQNRQTWLKEYLAENDFPNLPFVGRFRSNNNIEDVAADIRQVLGLTGEWASAMPNWEKALSHLAEKIEEQGIVIVFNGVVENNNYRKIPVSDCRGFVMVDPLAPFMFINNADAKAAQMFTIAHELAHIWIGQSAGFDFRNMQAAPDPIEQFCDKVAAELLVPESHFTRVWQQTPDISKCSRHFKVSEIVIARRALDTGKLTRDEFFDFYRNYMARWQSSKGNRPSGGDFYVNTRKRLSMPFAAHVNNALKSGQLLHRDAYKLTGLKGDTFQTFFENQFVR